MAKRQVFYSFHFDNDAMRVQQIRNIGALEDNKPVSPNDWEAVKKGGDAAIRTWIDAHMSNRSCVVVLVGAETAHRKWVSYEIEKAWDDNKGLFGIYIHNLKDPTTGRGPQGSNPFEPWIFEQSGDVARIACYNPNPTDAYGDIARNMEKWVETAIAQRV